MKMFTKQFKLNSIKNCNEMKKPVHTYVHEMEEGSAYVFVCFTLHGPIKHKKKRGTYLQR